MSSPSPPKPWETSGGATSASVGLTVPSASPAVPVATATLPSAPPLPSVPDSLNTVANRNANANAYSAMNNRYGSPCSSGYGGMSSYSSPYSSYGGGYGSSMYGGMGGMGGMYGGTMGGMGGMYGSMGMGGMGYDPNNPQSLTQSFSQSTAATFQLIENIVGAFGGFAQMLQSTYMATHSSFFAMVSVAEQFGNLRQTLGSVLGIYTVMRWIRMAVAKLTGRQMPASSKQLTPANFAAFTGRMADGSPAPAKPSKKPFFVFMMAVFGLPYLMGKLIKTLARSQEEEEKRKMEQAQQASGQPIDPNKLEFCRALYDFIPGVNMQGMDLSVHKGDMVAVLSKRDPMGNVSEWWRCRSRDGRIGYLPGTYLETIQRKQPAQITCGSQSGSTLGSKTQAMASNRSRAEQLTESKTPERAPVVNSEAGDVGVESFQKSTFYS